MATDLRTAAQQALELLKELQGGCTDSDDGTVEALTVWCPELIENLEAALEQPEQEPVAWMCSDENLANKGYSRFSKDKYGAWNIPVFTHPPRREWRGLTEEDIWTLAANCLDSVLGRLHFARAIEATLKERNHE
jgi:hypothetical protein